MHRWQGSPLINTQNAQTRGRVRTDAISLSNCQKQHLGNLTCSFFNFWLQSEGRNFSESPDQFQVYRGHTFLHTCTQTPWTNFTDWSLIMVLLFWHIHQDPHSSNTFSLMRQEDGWPVHLSLSGSIQSHNREQDAFFVTSTLICQKGPNIWLNVSHVVETEVSTYGYQAFPELLQAHLRCIGR